MFLKVFGFLFRRLKAHVLENKLEKLVRQGQKLAETAITDQLNAEAVVKAMGEEIRRLEGVRAKLETFVPKE